MRIGVGDGVAERLTGAWMMGKNTGRREPAREQVSRLAYSLYERRGRADGHDLEDWLQAEAELTQHR